MITCQPIVFQELHKGSFNIIGRRSNLIKAISYLLKEIFYDKTYSVTHLFFTF